MNNQPKLINDPRSTVPTTCSSWTPLSTPISLPVTPKPSSWLPPRPPPARSSLSATQQRAAPRPVARPLVPLSLLLPPPLPLSSAPQSPSPPPSPLPSPLASLPVVLLPTMADVVVSDTLVPLSVVLALLARCRILTTLNVYRSLERRMSKTQFRCQSRNLRICRERIDE